MTKDQHARSKPQSTRSQSARTATIERKAARMAKRFIVGGAK